VALAVDHAQAAAALLQGQGDEMGEAAAGFVAGEAVQVEFALHHPAPAAQVGEHPAGQADPQVGGFVAGVEAVFEGQRAFEGLAQHLALVFLALAGQRGGQRALYCGQVAVLERGDLAGHVAEQAGGSCSCSASMRGRGLGLAHGADLAAGLLALDAQVDPVEILDRGDVAEGGAEHRDRVVLVDPPGGAGFGFGSMVLGRGSGAGLGRASSAWSSA
jgi:hypothetical protein